MRKDKIRCVPLPIPEGSLGKEATIYHSLGKKKSGTCCRQSYSCWVGI